MINNNNNNYNMSDGGNGFDKSSNRQEFGSRSNIKPGRFAQNDQDN